MCRKIGGEDHWRETSGAMPVHWNCPFLVFVTVVEGEGGSER